MGMALVGAVYVGACADKKGALILAINTDMKAPKDVNAVSVTVSTNGAIKHSFIGRVTPDGEVLLPATLAIVQPDDASASIRVRVMAFQERKPRVLRDVRTTVPRDGRTGLLRIPLNFINDGMLSGPMLPNGVLPPTGSTGGGPSGGTSGGGGGTSGSGGGTSGSGGGTSGGMSSSGDTVGSGAAGYDFFGSFQPPCPDIENQTVIDGECKDNAIDPAALPDYDDTLVFGSGKDGSDHAGCFDMPTCYGGASQVQGGGSTTMAPVDGRDAGADSGIGMKTVSLTGVTIDTSTCSVNGVADPSQLNLAIVTPDTGECVRPGECYIPIDQGPSGWHVENGRIQLPSLVCKLLGKGLRLFASSGTCRAKTENQPICRPQPAMNSNPGGDGQLRCLTSCGQCVTQHCAHDAIAQCFGPDWDKGNVTGVCAPLYQCGCTCSDFSNCKQCDAAMGSACETCLQQNINACADQPCKQFCDTMGQSGTDGGGLPDSGGNNGVMVNLSFQGGSTTTPPVGDAFNATMGGFQMPVPGDDAVTASDNAGAISMKFEYCHGSLTVGKQINVFGFPGCSGTGGNPSLIVFAKGGQFKAVEGMATVMSLNPLGIQFQNVFMQPADAMEQGSFTLSGPAIWHNVNASGP
jgi:hypothetical protein